MVFSYTEKVRFSDINIGCHLSNDKVLVYLTECTDQFLRSVGHHLGDFFGAAVIFSEVNIKYIREVKYPNAVRIQMIVEKITEFRILFSYQCYDELNQLTHIAKIKGAVLSLQDQKVININQNMIDILRGYQA